MCSSCISSIALIQFLQYEESNHYGDGQKSPKANTELAITKTALKKMWLEFQLLSPNLDQNYVL
jgi:hypothetical protein